MKYIYSLTAAIFAFLGAFTHVNADDWTIWLSASPAEGGTVSGAGTYPIDSEQVITATPASGWAFAGWNDGNMDASRTIKISTLYRAYVASFVRLIVVTVNASPAEAGSVAGGGYYSSGTHQDLTATANNGWVFSGWSDGIGEPVRQIVVPSTDTTYTALFKQPEQMAISVLANPTNGGSVTGSGSYSIGSEQTITATAKSGWRFIGWNDGTLDTNRVITVARLYDTFVANFAFITNLPAIVSQPSSQSVVVGTRAVFNVEATGTEPLTYQWWFKGSPLVSATNAVFTLDNVQPGDEGDYGVSVGSPYGRAIGTNFTLSVLEPPVITAQPQSQSAVAGTTLTLNVTVKGIAPFTYQWWFNGSPLQNETNASITLNNLQKANSGDYGVAVGNLDGQTSGTNFTLTVLQLPVITLQPQSQSALVGTTVSFSVAATGLDPISFQWWFNGSPILNATKAKLTLSNIQAENAGIYAVQVFNPNGNVLSSNVNLKVLLPPSITAQPQSQNVAVGGNVTFSVSATGSAPLAYQWYFNGVAIPGAIRADLTLNNVQTSNAGAYVVMVINPDGRASSASANLSVSSAPMSTRLAIARQAGNQYLLSFSTESGHSYTLQYADSLKNASWQTVQTVPGDGNAHAVTAAATSKLRFYRLEIK